MIFRMSSRGLMNEARFVDHRKTYVGGNARQIIPELKKGENSQIRLFVLMGSIASCRPQGDSQVFSFSGVFLDPEQEFWHYL